VDDRLETRVVEATAPVCIDLVGGMLDEARVPLDESAAVCVAIDRRALCRVETGRAGLRIELNDPPFRAEGRDVGDLLAAGCPPLAPSVLRRLGIDAGLSITMHSRIPSGSGLGSSALAVAVAAAVSSAVEGDSGLGAILQLARDVLTEPTGGVHGLHGAIQGGVLAFHLDPGTVTAARLSADPGRVEESLLLVDTAVDGSGPVPEVPASGEGRKEWSPLSEGKDQGEIAALAREVGQALAEHRYGEVGGLIAREWEVLKRLKPVLNTPRMDQLVTIASAAGGAARPCSGSRSGWTLVWAPPGERGEGSRERVEAALRGAGFRSLGFRVDLRGLEVE
jgi:galactokinase/mevalonate kinase-like predicted kinase